MQRLKETCIVSRQLQAYPSVACGLYEQERTTAYPVELLASVGGTCICKNENESSICLADTKHNYKTLLSLTAGQTRVRTSHHTSLIITSNDSKDTFGQYPSSLSMDRDNSVHWKLGHSSESRYHIPDVLWNEVQGKKRS